MEDGSSYTTDLHQSRTLSSPTKVEIQSFLLLKPFSLKLTFLHLDDVIKISPSTPQLKLVWFFVGLLVAAAATIDASRWQILCFFQQIRVFPELRNKWVGFTSSISLSITLWILIFQSVSNSIKFIFVILLLLLLKLKKEDYSKMQ